MGGLLEPWHKLAYIYAHGKEKNASMFTSSQINSLREEEMEKVTFDYILLFS